MRLVIQKHAVTTRCERCLPGVLEQHHTCFHVLEEHDDGSPDITLIVRSDAGENTYNLTPELVELMRTEGPETVLAELETWQAQQSPE